LKEIILNKHDFLYIKKMLK